MAGDEPQQQPAAWPRLQPASAHLQSLHKSLASRSAIVPLKRVSNTIEEVKKNGQQLLVTAQTALQNGLNDDWALLKRVGTPADARRTTSAASMRRVASDTNFQRPGRLVLQRSPATAVAAASGPLTREQQRQADAWDWLSALNTTLNQARAAQQSKFTLPTKVQLEEQVRCPRGRHARTPAVCCYLPLVLEHSRLWVFMLFKAAWLAGYCCHACIIAVSINNKHQAVQHTQLSPATHTLRCPAHTRLTRATHYLD